MILLKLNLINRKISNFLKIDVNALAWIFIGITTVFIITLTHLHQSDHIKERYNEHFPKVEVEQVKEVNQVDASVKETVETDKKTDKNKHIGIILILISIFISLQATRMIIYG